MDEIPSLARLSSIAAMMTIDPEKVSNTITNFLIEKLNDQRARGILLGLSGGIDSAVVTTLAVRAVGPKNVFTLHLFDRDSQSRFLAHAEGLADKLGIHLETRDITSLEEETLIYESPVLKRVSILRGLNVLIIDLAKVLYFLKHRSRLVTSMMRRTTLAKSRIIGGISSIIRDPLMRSFEIKHIVRRRVLEDYMARRNLLLVGAANRSEWLTGWFIKNGVDDLPIEPLLGLYKTQVYQLAHFLDVPSEIINEPPSPDFFKGFSDETLIGASWEKVDRVLYVLMKGLDEEVALADGVTAEEFHRIKRRYELSHPRREGMHHYPSIQP